MRELLQKYLGKNNAWSAVAVHEPHLDGISQKDLLYSHDFSYCDVKPSSPTKNEIAPEPQWWAKTVSEVVLPISSKEENSVPERDFFTTTAYSAAALSPV